MALILRNGGSQSPDRWLKEPRNNHKEQLTEDQAAALDQIMDDNLNLLADELEQNFRNGFCLGVKMMCEVFGK